jgi:predicted MFS family arabinose efflux permease
MLAVLRQERCFCKNKCIYNAYTFKRLEEIMSEVHRTSKVITLVVTCLASFMILLDASIVTLALPRIQADLHTGLSGLQWVVDAYTLPFAVLMLTAGTLGDRFGRKRLFLVGLVLFLLGSLLCGFSPTLSWLLFGRVVQGVGAAALSTGSLSVLAAAFPEPRHDGRLMKECVSVEPTSEEGWMSLTREAMEFVASKR